MTPVTIEATLDAGSPQWRSRFPSTTVPPITVCG
jgi:hypothetical protein